MSFKFPIVSIILVFVNFFFATSNLQGQDVEGFFTEMKDRIKNDPFKLSGGISAASNFSHTTGIPDRYAPFNWNLNANLNFDILGIKAPFSFNYSNGNSVYNLPSYRFVGVSPSYKWITLHLGDRSMNFSPYSLSGHNFFGTGIELKPGKFRFSAMYGRLKRATAVDLNNLSNLDPSYKRMGYGFKAGYVNKRDEIHFTFFSAKDDESSFTPTPEFDVRAKENVVLEVNGKKSLGSKLYLVFDIARSAFTSDVSAPIIASESGAFRNLGGIIDNKLTTGYFTAGKGGIGFDVSKKTNFQFNYERIDPGYRTLGALFFNDDLENFTVSSATSLFKSKLNLTGSLGVQRDNLSGFESNTNNRIIGNVSATFTPGERMLINGSYSNFRNSSKVRFKTDPFNPVDSVSLALINQNANLAVSYALGKEKKAMLTTMVSYQKANSIVNEELLMDQNSDFVTGSVMYAYSFSDIKLNLAAGVMANYSVLTSLETFFYAPNVSISKNFLEDQLTSSVSLAYSSIYLNNVLGNKVFNIRAQSSYKFLESHNVGLTLGLSKNNATNTGNNNSFSEFIGSLRYSYNFKLK